MTIRVALVDDQVLFRAGIAMLIGSQPDLDVVGEAADGSEVAELVETSRPDVVLMDVRMSTMDGVAATRELVATYGVNLAPSLLAIPGRALPSWTTRGSLRFRAARYAGTETYPPKPTTTSGWTRSMISRAATMAPRSRPGVRSRSALGRRGSGTGGISSSG